MNKVKVWYQQNGQIKKVVLDSTQLKNFIQEHNVLQMKNVNRICLLQPKVTLKEFCEMFSQLDMILKSGIHLYEALDIALKNSQNSKLKEILSSMKDAINSGKPIFQALEKHESIVNSVLIGFFKIAHTKGNTDIMIGAMSKILRLQEKNRALLKSQLSYPLIIAITLCIALSVIFLWYCLSLSIFLLNMPCPCPYILKFF